MPSATTTIHNTDGSTTLAAPGYTPPPTGPQPISVSTLQSTPTPYNVTQPQPPPLFDTSGLDSALKSTYTPTAGEQGQSDIITALGKLNQTEASKAGYESDLASKSGLTMTTDENGNPVYNDPSVNDLQTKLTTLANQAKAIPLQVQQDFTGRGATAAGVTPIQTAQLRDNSIQALNVSSLIAAKQGQLATAKMYIDQAVTQKYGPIEAEIKALTSNLALVKQDPTTTLQEKQRADQQQQILNDRQNQIDLEKTNYQNAQTEALKYAPVASADQLTQLQQAKTPEDVATMAASMGLKTLADQKAASDLSMAPLDRQLKEAQISSAQADVALKRAQASGYANPALLAAVQNGTIDPSKVNSRTAPFYSALANAGVDANSATINAAAAKSVITNLDTQASQITQAGQALESNMNLLAGLSDKANKLGIPAADTITNSLISKYSNQPDIVNYLNTLNTVRSEYAKYLSRGGEVTDSVRNEAASGIPVGVDGATLKSLLSTIQTEGRNVQSSITAAKNNQWDQLKNGSQPTAQDGDTHVYNGVTYKVVNGQWVAQ